MVRLNRREWGPTSSGETVCKLVYELIELGPYGSLLLSRLWQSLILCSAVGKKVAVSSGTLVTTNKTTRRRSSEGHSPNPHYLVCYDLCVVHALCFLNFFLHSKVRPSRPDLAAYSSAAFRALFSHYTYMVQYMASKKET
jgi:hypothetical protein